MLEPLRPDAVLNAVTALAAQAEEDGEPADEDDPDWVPSLDQIGKAAFRSLYWRLKDEKHAFELPPTALVKIAEIYAKSIEGVSPTDDDPKMEIVDFLEAHPELPAEQRLMLAEEELARLRKVTDRLAAIARPLERVVMVG